MATDRYDGVRYRPGQPALIPLVVALVTDVVAASSD